MMKPLSMSKALYPSGLRPVVHSDKCYAPWELCVCRIGKKVAKNLCDILDDKNKAWAGSSVRYEGDFAIVEHPSGAVAKIRWQHVRERS
jgi:hypothetical protein